MKLFSLLSIFFFLGCNSSGHLSGIGQKTADYTNGGKIFSSVYQQKAAEYRALCFQGYNVAAFRIQAFHTSDGRPKAIITDIDETILDNSPYAVHQGLQGKGFDLTSWYEWTSRADADTMPGAASFLKYVAAQNIEVFYITNREESERKATLKNLQKFSLPNADDAHLLSRVKVSSKESRRNTVAETHDVILLMGDNLADFSELFDKKTSEERRINADRVSSSFGNKFIVFPNPNYGDWESSLFHYNYKLTAFQKDSIYRAVLQNY